MKKRIPLVLEQLEDRIFLDANPLMVADGEEPVADVPSADPVVTSAADPEEQGDDAVAENNGDDQLNEEGIPASENEEDTQVDETSDVLMDEEGAGSGENSVESEDGTDPENITVAEDSQELVTNPGADSEGVDGEEIELIDPMIGEDFTFTYTFDNVMGQTGYGPYVDIYFPTTGEDGQPIPAVPGSDPYDGVGFVSATYLGAPVAAVNQTFDVNGEIEHAFLKDAGGNPVIITGIPGDTYVSLQLPYGSYTPTQPSADIIITAHMSNIAKVDQPLTIKTSSGFMFGSDALDNPSVNPPLVNQVETSTAWLPEVIRFEKQYVGPEGETATGPSYVRSYSITVDVAEGQTVTNLRVVDDLPANIVYVGNVQGGTVIQAPTPGNNVLIVDMGTVTGGAGNDGTVTFDFYVGDILADCQNSLAIDNNMQLEADWIPLDPRDQVPDGSGNPTHLIVNAEVYDDGTISSTPDVDETFEAQPIVIQKSATDINGGDSRPGDIIKYQLEFQVSDYAAMGDIEIRDLMPDGMEFLTTAGYEANFFIQDSNANYIGNFTDTSDIDVTVVAGNDNQIDFHIGQAIINTGDADGILQGPGDNPADGIADGPAAKGTITYYGRIAERYVSPGEPVSQGDVLSNSVAITSAQVYNYDLAGGLLCTITNPDNSSAEVQLPQGAVAKSVYAIDGNLVSGGSVHISPGSDVTYRLTYRLPTSDIEYLYLDDYLPLPVFDVTDPDNNPATPTDWTVDHFSQAEIGNIPAVGNVTFGPLDSYYLYSGGDATGQTPAITWDAGKNALEFKWGAYDSVNNSPSIVDLLFTVRVSSEPFTDGLHLTNLVDANESGVTSQATSDDIAQIVLEEPDLEITKGVIAKDTYSSGQYTAAVGPVAFTDPGSGGFRGTGSITESGLDTTPIDSDITGIDAGDRVSFGITVRNVGHYNAYNVEIGDDMPSGFAIPALAVGGLNLTVTDGQGHSVDFTDRSGDLYGTVGFDFFGEGLTIVPSLAENRDADISQTDNILFISYDLIAETTVQPQQKMTNTGIVERYTAAPNGTNFVPDGIKDEAFVTVTEPTLDKVLVDTGISDAGSGLTDGNNERTEAVIGERVTYSVSITLQEGTTANAVLIDHLDRGLELATIDSIAIVDETGAVHSGVSSSIWGADFTTFTSQTDASNANITYNYAEGGSSSFSLNLGELTNSNTDNRKAEVVVVTYTAIVVNDSDNQQGVTRNNSAALTYDVPTDAGPVNKTTGSDSAENITIIEPNLLVIKTVNVQGVDSGPSGQIDDQNNPDFVYGDAGDPVIYTIVVKNETGSPVAAHEVDLSDSMPGTELEGFTITSAMIGGVDVSASFALSGSGNHVLSTNTPFDLDVGETLTLIIGANLKNTIVAGVDISNEAHVEWTSYPGTPVVSGFVNRSDIDAERTGNPADPGGAANDYNDWDPTEIVTLTPANKFIINSEITNEIDATDDGLLDAPADSDGLNRGREATIGETITYRVEIELPEASLYNVHAVDTLDPGLTLVSIDSISVVATNPAEIHITNSGLLGGPYTDATDPNISYSYNSGNTADILTLDFGTITNDNRDNSQTEYLVLEYTVMVTDIGGNTSNAAGAGTLLANDYETSWTDGPGGARETGAGDSAETVEVIEPDLNIVKALTNVDGPGDAGDEVTYTITVSHAENECGAFDLNISDTFDTNIGNLSISSAQINGSDVAGNFSITGQVLSTDTPQNIDLAIGETLVLVVKGTLSNSVNPGDTIPNSATVTWTSIDGIRTDFSGFASNGNETHEREYTDSDTAPVITVPGPTISKVLVGTDMNDSANENNEATLGEFITYRVTVDLSEGVTNTATVVDTLSAGIEFVDVLSVTGLANGSNVTSNIGGGLEGNLTIAGASSGQNITFTLGDLTVTGDNTGAPPVGGNDQGKDQVIITYRAVVKDIAGNEAISSSAETFQNAAAFNYVNDAGAQATTTVEADSVTLVEPDLEIIKTVNGLADGVVLGHVDAGDTVTYEITLRHSSASGSGAYDVLLADDLPDADILFASGIAGIQSVVDSASTLTVNDFWIANNDTLQFAINGQLADNTIDMDYGRVITVTLVGILKDAVQPGESITNTSVTNWTSLPSTHSNNGNADERGLPYTDTIYTDSDDAVIQIETPQIEKLGTGTFTIGEEVTFTINVTLPEGTTEDLIVTDVLPPGLVLVGTPTADTTTNFDGTVPALTVTTPGNNIVFDYSGGSVVTNGNSGTDLNVISFTVVARVENIAGNYDSAPDLVNSTHMTYTDGNGSSQTVGTPTASVDIVEPEISTYKSVLDETGDQLVDHLGEVLTYTATFVNTGTSTAFDVTALDNTALGTGNYTLVSATHSLHGNITGDTDFTPNAGASTIDFSATGAASHAWDIEAGESVTVVYTAEVLGAWFTPGNHINVIDADWSSLSGNKVNERIYDDSSTRNPGMSQDGGQDTATALFVVPYGDGSIGDTVWFDANGDGLQGLFEPGIANVQISTVVSYAGGSYTATTTTDGSGNYLFAHLQAATYTVTVDSTTLPGGMTQTYDLNGPLDDTATVPLALNERNPYVDFGYDGVSTGVIGDTVWYDANRNGGQDATEIGIQGALVRLDGDINSNGNYDYTTFAFTDASGKYQFTNLPFVDYIVTVIATPSGFNDQTYDKDLTLDNTSTTSLVGAPSDQTMDFGYVGPGEIGDFIWDDLNADGVQDAGETGLVGIDLTLQGDLNHDGIVDFSLQTTTIANGYYHFDGLPVADYTITVDSSSLPTGYIQSGDPDGSLDNSAQLALAGGSMINLDQDFGYTKTGSIGDTVWFDANANTVQDSGEPGLSGVTVTLTGDIDLDGVIDTLTTVTDAAGQYLFDDLPTGNYDISVDPITLPGGMKQTYDADGIATADTTNVALGYGEENRNTDFGYTGTGSIGDTVWYDANRNGLLDGTESGIANVLMTLDADINSDGIVDYTIAKRTNGSGKYLFENLPVGRYTITLDPTTLPPNLTQTYDPDSLMDGSSNITLGAGENNLAQDFAYALPSTPPQPPQPLVPAQPFFPEPPDMYDGGEDDDRYDVDDFLTGPALSQRAGVFQPALNSMPTMYTGQAEPGTMLHLTMYDAQGNVLATHMAPVDTGGNWLADLQVGPESETPHRVVIQQNAAVYNRSTEGGFNLRTNFSPSFGSKAITSLKGDVSSVMGGLAEQVVEDLHKLYNGSVDVRWDSAKPYESSVVSTNPGQNNAL